METKTIDPRIGEVIWTFSYKRIRKRYKVMKASLDGFVSHTQINRSGYGKKEDKM
jgi:hypothetical protein